MSYEIIVGDCLEQLRGMEAASVQCCITSSPYFGLRDYGTGEWEGGDAECDHKMATEHQKQGQTSQRQGRSNTEDQCNENFRDVCGKCGATRIDKQIGLEPTPDEYVAKLVEVFGEVKRVLRDDGTLWLNLGDSYTRSAGPRNGNFGRSAKGIGIPENRDSRRSRGYAKSKDLLGIPWMVAFALRADGWWLRSEIIWNKPNPMPESVTDRPTKAHEQVFLLSKSPRYYYDAEAIKDRYASGTAERYEAGGFSDRYADAADAKGYRGPFGGKDGHKLGTGANKRSVWTVATQPYPDAHYATFPPKLIEPMVLAGCPREGVVLDPFAGSGTTLQVAVAHGRSAVGIELNPEYAELARRRLAGVTPSMFDLEPAA